MNELPFTLTSYPRLGVPQVFTEPHFDPANAVSSHSLFLPEEITNPHARFPSVIPQDRPIYDLTLVSAAEPSRRISGEEGDPRSP